MHALPPYRVLSRWQAFLLIGAILAVGAAVLGIGHAWVDAHVAATGEAQRTNPQAAIAALVTHLKILAVIQILPLTAFCAFMIWYCRRAIESQSMPPAGAWIVEGQRIRTGSGAVRKARILLALTGVMTLVGAIAVVYLYYIAVSLQASAGGA